MNFIVISNYARTKSNQRRTRIWLTAPFHNCLRSGSIKAENKNRQTLIISQNVSRVWCVWISKRESRTEIDSTLENWIRRYDINFSNGIHRGKRAYIECYVETYPQDLIQRVLDFRNEIFECRNNKWKNVVYINLYDDNFWNV